MFRREIISFICAVISLSFILSGCASSSASNSLSDISKESSEKDSASVIEEEDITFAPVTVVDHDECTVIVTGIEEDDFSGYFLNIALENKSTETTYMFSVERGSVNGLLTEFSWGKEVAPGKKSNDTIRISDSAVDEVGKITDIELIFRIYNADESLQDSEILETGHIYLYGKENATLYKRDNQPGDKVLVDDENLKIVVIVSEEDTVWGYALQLYLENKTNKNIMYAVNNSSINGGMADPYWATMILAGKSGYSEMSWSEETLKENGIFDASEMNEIKFELTAYDYETFYEYLDETLVLNIDQ